MENKGHHIYSNHMLSHTGDSVISPYDIALQWNLSVTTTSIIRFITYD